MKSMSSVTQMLVGSLVSILFSTSVFAQNLVYTPTASSHVGRTPQSIASGDFNQDGFLDLATVNSTSDDVSILLSNGNGTFRSAMSFGVGKIPMAVSTKDLDAGGILDLIVATSGADRIVVLKGKGSGLFEKTGTYPSGKGATFVVLDDLDGNGSPDIATANSGRFGYYPPFSVSVLLNKGAGTFRDPVLYETDGRDGMFQRGSMPMILPGTVSSF